MNDIEKQYVKDIYYNAREEGSYGTLKQLYSRIKRDGIHNIRWKDLLGFMRGEEVFTSHIAKNKPKQYAKVIAPYNNYSVEFDSATMPFPDKNEIKYMVVGQDVFSKKTAARAVRSLKADVVNQAVNEILDELGPFEQVRTDRGTEYYNKTVKATFDRRNIRHIPSFEPNKSVFAENAIRRIKSKLYKIMQHNGDHNWNPHLQDVIYNINHTKSPALAGLSPVEVNNANVPDIWFKLMHKDLKTQPKPRKYEFSIDDAVRIRYSRGTTFRKEFSEQMGAKVFYIQDRFSPGNNHLYKVRDDRGELLPGRFRPSELQKVSIGPDTVWRLDGDPIRYRTVRGQRQAYVRFLDYDDTYNQWIPAEEVRDLQVRNVNREGGDDEDDNRGDNRRGRRPPARGRRRRRRYRR